MDDSRYCALRVCPAADAHRWWLAVRRRRDVPDAIATLRAGRNRIELTRVEAERALAWASRVEGWADAGTKPLYVYP